MLCCGVLCRRLVAACYIADLLRRVMPLTCCDMFFCQLVTAYFTVDLLRRVVVLLTVSFFMVFALAVQVAKFDPTESSIKSCSSKCC